jgi:hypothetical protein
LKDSVDEQMKLKIDSFEKKEDHDIEHESTEKGEYVEENILV